MEAQTCSMITGPDGWECEGPAGCGQEGKGRTGTEETTAELWGESGQNQQ